MGPRGNAAPDSRTGTPATSSSPATSSPLATLAGRLYPLTYTPPTVPQPRCPVRNAGTWYQIASCCWDSMSVGPVIYGALCPPILQSTGPCAPQSCNLQGRLPPVSTILELSYPSTPPYSSPRGLRAPPIQFRLLGVCSIGTGVPAPVILRSRLRGPAIEVSKIMK